MIKTNNKNVTVLKKLYRIEELIDKLNKHYDDNIEFDNSTPNKYKLLVHNKEFVFGTYNDVINALEFNCASELMMY